MASGTATRRAALRAVLARCASPVLTLRQAARRTTVPPVEGRRSERRTRWSGHGRCRAISLEDKFTRSDGPRLPDRPAGAGPAADGADPARPRGGAQDRGLHLRLSRLAARRLRPAAARRRKQHLDAHDIVFQPGVNEDLAATAVWGSQQLQLSPGARYDGVVGIWYGKGPGVDRSGDVLKHANAAGSSRHGGVLCLAGDDHGAKSSSIPHQSDHAFMSALMPMLYPSSIHEFIEHGAARHRDVALLGLLGRHEADLRHGRDHRRGRSRGRGARVRHPGRLRACRRTASTCAGRTTAGRRITGCRTTRATRRSPSAGRTASIASVFDCPSPRLGIVASGKAYEDVRQALRELEIDAATRGADRPARLQGRHALADRAGEPAPLLRGPGRGPGRRGAARDHRVPDQAVPVQLARRRAAADHRQVRPPGPAGAAARPRAHRGPRRRGPGRPHRPARGRARASPPGSRASSPTSSGAERSSRARARRSAGCPTSARAARTTPRPGCRKAAARWPASAATSWRSGWTAAPRPSPTWAPRACPGSARRRSPTRSTSSSISATAPTSTPASWRSARRSPRAPTSPTRSCSTTPSR